MSEVVEPVHMGPAVIEGMNELMCDHSGHMGLLVNVILTQNDLETNRNLNVLIFFYEALPTEATLSLLLPRSLSYLRRSCIKATADRPVTIFTREMSVFKHFAVVRGEHSDFVPKLTSSH